MSTHCQIFASLLTITKQVSADDKQVFPFESNQPFRSDPFGINWSYFSRVFLWRFFEITSRAFVCILVWVGLGGFALFCILCGEFLYLCYLGYHHGSYDVFTNFMYVVLISDYRDCQYFSFLLYRAIGPILLLIAVTLFAFFPFECWKCAQNSYAETFENKWVFGIYIYSWIASVAWPVAAYVLAKKRLNTLEDVWMFRDLKYITERPWIDIVELLEFGVPIPGIGEHKIRKSSTKYMSEPLLDTAGNEECISMQPMGAMSKKTEVSKVTKTTLLHRACGGGPLCVEYLKLLIKLHPDWVTQRDSNGRTPMECIVTNKDPKAWDDSVEMARMLLNTGNVIVGEGHLLQAALNSSLGMVKLLHANGCKLQFRSLSKEQMRDLVTVSKERKEIFEYVKEQHLGGSMQIFVRNVTYSGSGTITLDVAPDLSIYFVKILIMEKKGHRPEKQTLSCGGNILANERTLSDCNVRREDTLNLGIRM